MGGRSMEHGPNTNVVLRARDAEKLAQAKTPGSRRMLERVIISMTYISEDYHCPVEILGSRASPR
jgi:hypothetical protein